VNCVLKLNFAVLPVGKCPIPNVELKCIFRFSKLNTVLFVLIIIIVHLSSCNCRRCILGKIYFYQT
jgi:hypothetical protein